MPINIRRRRTRITFNFSHRLFLCFVHCRALWSHRAVSTWTQRIFPKWNLNSNIIQFSIWKAFAVTWQRHSKGSFCACGFRVHSNQLIDWNVKVWHVSEIVPFSQLFFFWLVCIFLFCNVISYLYHEWHSRAPLFHVCSQQKPYHWKWWREINKYAN